MNRFAKNVVVLLVVSFVFHAISGCAESEKKITKAEPKVETQAVSVKEKVEAEPAKPAKPAKPKRVVSKADLAKMRAAMPKKAAVQPKAARKMLVFSLCKGFKHGSIPYWSKALTIMGRKTGAFKVVHSKDMSVFNAANLAKFDAICFNNTTKLVPDAAQQKAIMDFIKGGKGIVGIHAATDNFYEWPQGNMMMGGVFTGHPWTAGGTWAVKLDDPKHPLMKMFGGKGFKINDEIYRTSPPQYSRSNQRVLMSLDMSDETTKNTKGVKPDDMDTGITWVKSVGKGRLFYCSLGHNNHLTWNKPVLEHYLAGIRFAMGDIKADTTPVKPASGDLSEIKGLDEVLAAVAEYEDGQSRAALVKFEEIVHQASYDESKRTALEVKLIEFLAGDTTKAAKQFICQQLGLIGSSASADLLGRLIIDESTSDMARYAAERIQGAEIDTMLIDAVRKTSGNIRIGIINTLGVRKTAAAVAAIAKMINASDEKLSLAAIEALKRIGNAEAMGVLAKKKDVFKGMLHEAVMDAYLSCVDGLLAAGETEKAAAAYKQSYQLVESAPIRIAAVQGMLNAAGENKGGIILDVLKSDDKAAQTVVLSAVRQLKPAAIEPILAKFDSLSDAGKVQLITAVDQMKTEAVLATVVKAASSESQALRLAAIKALAFVGDGESAKLLAKIAANSKASERNTARASLYSLAAEGANEAILASFEGADAGVKIELLRAVAARKIDNSKQVLYKGIHDSDPKVCIETLRTISVTQNVELVKLLDVLTKAEMAPERSQVAKTIVTIVTAKGDTTEDTMQIVELMPHFKTKGVDTAASALRILGRIGNDRGYDTLIKALSGKDKKIQRAAIDGLSQWPDGKAAKALKKIALGGLNKQNEVMAFRGFVDQLGKIKGAQAIQLYAEAMEIAPNDGEKRRVLSALARKPNIQTLEIALDHIEAPELKSEAEAAVLDILNNMDTPIDGKALPVLLKAKSKVTNDAIEMKLDNPKLFGGELESVGGDLSAWAKPLGQWEVAGKVIKSPDDETKLSAEKGTGVIYNGPNGRTKNLLTKEKHGDVTAHIEFMVPKGSNSGIYFMGRYEIQVFDSWGVADPQYSDCGGIYRRLKDAKGSEGRAPLVNASKEPGWWQSFDVVFKAPRFDENGKKIANAMFVEVYHNGKLVQKDQEVTGMTCSGAYPVEEPTGPLMLQGDHGPVAYRNIYLIKGADGEGEPAAGGRADWREPLGQWKVVELNKQKLTIKLNQAELLSYQQQPLVDPIGGEKFKGSNFIHPLKTLSGFTLTQSQPKDHLHHFGLWWP